MAAPEKARVAVAMSGGVDSSVAALLLVRAGYEVVGISMRLYSYEREATHGCCTPEDLYDARRVADRLGIAHYVSDFEPQFERSVIDDFIRSYAAGETPNPCVRCNQEVKFSALLRRSEELGAAFLSTGHYARIERDGSRMKLLRAQDLRRDQSYFLFGLSQAELSKLLFPLGDLSKAAVRRLAREADLPVSDKPDSQEICFVPGDYADFVEKRIDGPVAGTIVSETGEILGRHIGIHRFTIGQRKGLGIPSLRANYVLSVGSDGTVVVGPDASLFRTSFVARDVRWTGAPAGAGDRLLAQIRSRFTPEPATIEGEREGKLSIRFDKPVRAITPGQAAVFYRGEELLGGGWIDAVSEKSASTSGVSRF